MTPNDPGSSAEPTAPGKPLFPAIIALLTGPFHGHLFVIEQASTTIGRDLANNITVRGGLMIWTFRETQQEFQWALSVRENHNARHYISLHTEVVAMLDYLDGIHQVGHDLPSGTPIRADSHVAQVGLLEFDPTQETTAQLQQPSTLAIINDLVTSTTNAYQGRVDPATNAQQAGVSQVYQRVEQLAVFSVLPYKK